MTRPSTLIPFILLIFLVIFSVPAIEPVKAQTENAYDLINTVNALRASKGLDPYNVDSYLMSYAQQHAEYMASIQYSTHTHSDGSIAWQSGIQENVAEGTEGIITSAFVVYQIWSDWVHWHVMVDYASGDVGAGVALGDDGMVYYVLNVRAGDTVQPVVPTTSSGSAMPTSSGTRTPTLDLIAAMIKSTPAPDGSITHIVGYGQSLWSIAIAYDMKIDQIRSLNGLAQGSTTIVTGQQLLIRPAFTQTATLSPEEAATRTKTVEPTEIPPTATMKPTNTLIPSATPTLVALPIQETEPKRTQNSAAIAVTGISIVGLLVVVIFGFVRSRTIKKQVDDIQV